MSFLTRYFSFLYICFGPTNWLKLMWIWWILLNCCFILTIWSNSLLRVQGYNAASVTRLTNIILDAWWHVTPSRMLIPAWKPGPNKTHTGWKNTTLGSLKDKIPQTWYDYWIFVGFFFLRFMLSFFSLMSSMSRWSILRGTWFGLWPLNEHHYLPSHFFLILLTLSVFRFVVSTAHISKGSNLGEIAARRRRYRLCFSLPHHPLHSPTPQSKNFQMTGGQEHRCWAICVSIKQLSGSGCLEMTETVEGLFPGVKVDVINGGFLSALWTDVGRRASCKWPPPDLVSCSCR